MSNKALPAPREHDAILADLQRKGLLYEIRDKNTGVVKQGVRWPGVLDLSHERGLIATETEIVQLPAAENGQLAVVKAIACFERDGRQMRFTGSGTHSPANANRITAGYPVEMAETRALTRACKQGINIGNLTYMDELPDALAEGEGVPQLTATNGIQQQEARRTIVTEEPARPNPVAAARDAARAAAGPARGPVNMPPATDEQRSALQVLLKWAGAPTTLPLTLTGPQAQAQTASLRARPATQAQYDKIAQRVDALAAAGDPADYGQLLREMSLGEAADVLGELQAAWNGLKAAQPAAAR